VLAALTHDVTREHASGIIEGHDVKRAAHDQRKFRFGPMAMRSEVGLPVGDDEKTLHRVIGRGVHVVIRASAWARRCLGGKLIEE
jgi:hypothetical protein